MGRGVPSQPAVGGGRKASRHPARLPCPAPPHLSQGAASLPHPPTALARRSCRPPHRPAQVRPAGPPARGQFPLLPRPPPQPRLQRPVCLGWRCRRSCSLIKAGSTSPFRGQARRAVQQAARQGWLEEPGPAAQPGAHWSGRPRGASGNGGRAPLPGRCFSSASAAAASGSRGSAVLHREHQGGSLKERLHATL